MVRAPESVASTVFAYRLRPGISRYSPSIRISSSPNDSRSIAMGNSPSILAEAYDEASRDEVHRLDSHEHQASRHEAETLGDRHLAFLPREVRKLAAANATRCS